MVRADEPLNAEPKARPRTTSADVELPEMVAAVSVAGSAQEAASDVRETSGVEVSTADKVEISLAEDAPEWRKELASRLRNYHSRRRRRPPRYPSLALKFDPPARSWTNASRAVERPTATSQTMAASVEAVAVAPVANRIQVAEPETHFETPELGNVIEFPRPLLPPPPRPDELAEPILDKPRILDAPEAVPKQVPLGGIVLEPKEPSTTSNLELPLQVAPLSARLVASLVDAALVVGASGMFALIATQLTPIAVAGRTWSVLLACVPAFLWTIYQYLLLTYAGSTPGLRTARLRLCRFDGSTPNRALRRWRSVAMVLSGLSLGLGFLWSFLDEDTLCWHDRITHTYLTSVGVRPATWITQAADRLAKLHASIRDAVTGALPQ